MPYLRSLEPSPASLILSLCLATAVSAPAQDFATFLGGSGADEVLATALVDGDRAVITGYSTSTNFPTTTGTIHSGAEDAFVALLDLRQNGAASVVFSRFLGGYGRDVGLDIAFSPTTQRITVVGATASDQFPVTLDALQGFRAGDYDGFLTQFDLTGQIVYSTYLGTSETDRLGAVVANPNSGVLTIAGFTNSSRFPTGPAPYQPQLAGRQDAVILRFDPALIGTNQILAGTYLGGTAEEGYFCSNCWLGNWDMIDLHVAADGRTTVCSRTASANFPVTADAFQPALSGVCDGFVTRLDAGLSQLLDSTFLGGSRYEAIDAVDVGADDVVTLCGYTYGSLPTTSTAPQTSFGGGTQDGFLTQLDWSRSGASQLVYSTYIGGAGVDACHGFVVEPSGVVTVVGHVAGTSGTWNGTPGALQGAPAGRGTGFVLRLDPLGYAWAGLHYFSYVGAGATQNGGETLTSILLFPDGKMLLTGCTDNSAYPVTPSAPQPSFGGGRADCTVMLLDLLPTPVQRYGHSSPTCHRPAYMHVNGQPAPRNAAFELHCNYAPASAAGALLIGPPATSALQILGLDLWISPHPTTIGLPAGSDARGFARLNISIPASVPLPLNVGTQWLWMDSNPCTSVPLVVSDALRM